MKSDFIATENENNETADSTDILVSDSQNTGENSSLVNDIPEAENDTQSDYSSIMPSDESTDKELAVTELNSYTIDDIYNTQSELLVETKKTNQINGGLLFSAILFIGVSFAWALGKWFSNLVN